MRVCAIAASVVLIAGCTPDVSDRRVPSSAEIQRLEGELAGHACIGDLRGWERNYRFARKTGLLSQYSLNPDLDIIEFHLRRAGAIRIDPGRNIFAPAAGGDWPDSDPIDSMDGRFALRSGKLSLSPCEPARQD